jgi:HK97 gp10 family phage protein
MMYFKITGQNELANTLAKVSVRLQKEASLKAVVSAMQPLVLAAKRNVAKSRRTGELDRSIGFFIRKYRRGRLTFAVLGARRGMGSGKNEPANYAHLVEQGHMKKNGKRVQGKPFMRPAFDEQGMNALKQMSNVFGQELKAAAMIHRSKRSRTSKGISAI